MAPSTSEISSEDRVRAMPVTELNRFTSSVPDAASSAVRASSATARGSTTSPDCACEAAACPVCAVASGSAATTSSATATGSSGRTALAAIAHAPMANTATAPTITPATRAGRCFNRCLIVLRILATTAFPAISPRRFALPGLSVCAVFPNEQEYTSTQRPNNIGAPRGRASRKRRAKGLFAQTHVKLLA